MTEKEGEARQPENQPKRDRIDEIADAYDHFQKRVMRILYGLISFAALSAVIFTYTQFQISARARDNLRTSATANRVARRAANLGRQIQASRVENIRSNCETQNVKHDGALVALDIQLLDALNIHVNKVKIQSEPLAKQLKSLENLLREAVRVHIKGNQAGAQLVATHDFATAIITALVEKRDCNAVVKAQS